MNTLIFDNRFIRELPADPVLENHRRQVIGACFSRVLPTSVAAPELVAYSKEVAEQLGLNQTDCDSDQFTQIFVGNQLLVGMDPYALCYGGHQFGHWAGQLGDGRAINLGEAATKQGHVTLQLKGSGPTPYSRSADGRAVLRSSVREFLCSEAMFHLGVPTTRALSLILTGESVQRDMFYDGRPKNEPGAVVCRVAQSFTRFGSFELLSSRGDTDLLRKLVNHTITTDFSHLGTPSSDVYLKWFNEVSQKTASMIVHWMRVGFVHGVMNTDNMSILGQTIDYGPYGWLENYDPAWTPNTTDAEGRRYCFGNQPQIAYWNLYKLANAISPLVESVESLQDVLNEYPKMYQREWTQMMAAKLGLSEYQPATDEKLITDLEGLLQEVETDMTLFYRYLANVNAGESLEEAQLSVDESLKPIAEAYYQRDQLTDDYKIHMRDWLCRYKQRLQFNGTDEKVRRQQMNSVNPKYVLRNYIAQLAIDKSEQGDHSLVNELLEILRHPYDEQPDKREFAKKRPDWAKDRAGCSMLSCSS